jgi:hypothetical protein
MKTNNFFSLKRFSRFLSAYLQINYKRYLFFFAGALIGIYCILLLSMDVLSSLNGMSNINTIHYTIDSYNVIFTFGLLALGIFVGTAFPELSEKIKSTNYLMLPASHFEKILSQFLIYMVGGSFLFLLIFWIDAHVARWTVIYLERYLTQKWSIDTFHFSSLWFWNQEGMPAGYFHFITFSLLCFLFSVRLFFKRFAVVKSIIAGFFIIAAEICFLVLCSHLFFPETEGFNVEIPVYNVTEHHINIECFNAVIFYISWLFFLPLAYFKLKETQA